MSKKLTVFFVSFIFLSSFNTARADIGINEFVSHPNSGEKEWVELLNTSGSPVDLTGWKLTELSSPGTNPKENDLLSLSGALNDILVFEISSSTLNDTGDSIGLYNGSNLIDRVTYGTGSTVLNYSINLTAPETGKSGALISGVWKTDQEPTKGAANPGTNLNNEDENNGSADAGGGESGSSGGGGGNATTANPSGSSSDSSSAKKVAAPQKIKTQIAAKQVAYVGIPFTLEGMVFGTQGEQVFSGQYFWNFGDGDSREEKIINTDRFLHTYFYPGEYTVTLDYFPKHSPGVSEATSQIKIKVVSANVSISKVGDTGDFFVELTNNTDYPADLSGWFLNGGAKSFTIPRNTILAAKKSIIIPGRVTGFSVADRSTLQLLNPKREVAFDYMSSFVSVPKPALSSKNTESQKPPVSSSNSENAISTQDLTAGVLNTGSVDTNPEESSSWPVIPIVSFIFIGASAGAVYFIRKNMGIKSPGNDFEILDE